MQIHSFSDLFIYKNKTYFSGIPFNLPILKDEDYKDAKIFTITPEFCFRPDKICHELWNDESLELILFYINKIKNISELTIGKNLYWFESDMLANKGLVK